MRSGAEYFLTPPGASQRRYEALRAYFVDDMPAAEVADRFGYSTASVHQMATLLRGGKMSLFTDPRPAPKGPRKATGELRARVLALRAAGHSVTEISAALTAEGLPVSAQTAWQILDAEGIGRLPRRDEGRRGPPPAGPGPGRPAARLASGGDGAELYHAGLLLLSRPWQTLACTTWSARRAIPSPGRCASQSVGTLLLASAPARPRPPCRLAHR